MKTKCPRCVNDNAEMIKTEKFMILKCEKCGFSMGTPREKSKNGK